MDQPLEIDPNQLLEAINAEFPKEFMICAQRLHIKKLTEKLEDAEKFNEVVKEPDA
jgi:hypothetical protein